MLTWHRLCLYFPRDEPPTPERILAMLIASGDFSEETRFKTIFQNGEKKSFTASLELVRERLALDRVSLMALGTRIEGDSPHVALNYRRDFGADFAVFLVNPASDVLTRESLPGYLQSLAIAAAAPVATLHTHESVALTSFGTWFPHWTPTDDELLAQESTPDEARQIPRELALRLTSRVNRNHFDRGRIPESVGWMNAWSADVIERIGREKVLAQPWERVTHLGNGSLLLIACADPPMANRLELLERIATIGEGLELEKLRRASGETPLDEG